MFSLKESQGTTENLRKNLKNTPIFFFKYSFTKFFLHILFRTYYIDSSAEKNSQQPRNP
jgi:hypothetical protein